MDDRALDETPARGESGEGQRDRPGLKQKRGGFRLLFIQRACSALFLLRFAIAITALLAGVAVLILALLILLFLLIALLALLILWFLVRILLLTIVWVVGHETSPRRGVFTATLED
ncbi:MAG TPA: hypothetical protein VG735_13460 [Caulobacterales bacterium]|nr:hypothetical protein [Caulobacterales bacterium]